MYHDDVEFQGIPRSPTVRARMKAESQKVFSPTSVAHALNIDRAKSSPLVVKALPSPQEARRRSFDDRDPESKDGMPNLLPPPGYKWQKPIFGLWLGTCGIVVVSCLRASAQEYNELFHMYYQPLIVMLAMFWLWGIAVRVFELMAIRYQTCFSQEEQRHLLNSRQVYQTASILSCVVSLSAAVFSYHCRKQQLDAAAIHPPVMFCLLIILLIVPVDAVYKETRLFFTWTFWRVTTPFREVTFADFLLADCLTSLAKALSDCERALCHMSTGPVMRPNTTEAVCGNSSWLIPFGLSLPYLWRLCQCIRVRLDTGNTAQTYNAIKYSTAFPVMFFSYMNYHTSEEMWVGFYRPLWIGSALLNSAYSYYWDIERDWEIQWFTAPEGGMKILGIRKPVLKSLLLYPQAFYWYLLASNLILRLSWTYKLSPHLRVNFNTVMLFAILEVFRRFQWLFVRLEVELRKIQSQRADLVSLVPPAHAPLHSKVDVTHILDPAPSGILSDPGA